MAQIIYFRLPGIAVPEYCDKFSDVLRPTTTLALYISNSGQTENRKCHQNHLSENQECPKPIINVR